MPPKARYTATIYAGTKDADWEKNPMAYQIRQVLVDSRTQLAPGGGMAISLKPATREELQKLKGRKL